MGKVMMFCIAGKHPGPTIGHDPSQKLEPAHQWRLVPVTRIDGEWVYDPSSGAQVYCCPIHYIKGEPQQN